jgi:HK97 gp10 family phage protein
MSEFISVEIKGLDELVEKMLEQGNRLDIKKALDAGGGVVKAAMHDEAPSEAGGRKSDHLKNNILVKSKIKASRGRTLVAAVVRIGPSTKPYPNSGTGKEGTVAFTTRSGKKVEFDSKNVGEVSFADVGRFLEFGTHGKYGSITPTPWMTQAFEQSKNEAQAKIIDKLKAALGLT